MRSSSDGDHTIAGPDHPGAVVLPHVKRSLDAADEDELVRRIARGDRRAFDELYRRTAPWLVVRLRRRCADEDVVADVMQETYLAVWRAAGSFAGGHVKGSAVGWLWTIAAHRLVDAFRRRARQAQMPPVHPGDTVAPAAEDEVMAGRVGQELEQALLVLPPEVAPGAAGDGSRRLLGTRDVAAARRTGEHREVPGPAGPDRPAGGAVMTTHPTPSEIASYADGSPGPATRSPSGRSRCTWRTAPTAVPGSPAAHADVARC